MTLGLHSVLFSSTALSNLCVVGYHPNATTLFDDLKVALCASMDVLKQGWGVSKLPNRHLSLLRRSRGRRIFNYYLTLNDQTIYKVHIDIMNVTQSDTRGVHLP